MDKHILESELDKIADNLGFIFTRHKDKDENGHEYYWIEATLATDCFAQEDQAWEDLHQKLENMIRGIIKHN